MSAEVNSIDRILTKESTYLHYYPMDPFYKKLPKEVRNELKLEYIRHEKDYLGKLTEHEITSLSNQLFSDIWQRYNKIFNEVFTIQRKDPALYFDLICSSEQSFVSKHRQSLNITEEEVSSWKEKLQPSTTELIEKIAGQHFDRESVVHGNTETLNISYKSMKEIYCTALSKTFKEDEFQPLYEMILRSKNVFSSGFYLYNSGIDHATVPLKVKVLVALKKFTKEHQVQEYTTIRLSSVLQELFNKIPDLPEPSAEEILFHKQEGTLEFFNVIGS